jgi:hypothetical protein
LSTVPLSSCDVPAGSLAGSQKDDLAQASTWIPAEETGAPAALVHVIYTELRAETLADRTLHLRESTDEL